jgi:dTMP kinase
VTQPPSSPPPERGLFVAFEGGDGAGKSTQVRLLVAALSAAGRRVVVTRQPGGTELGSQIRDLLLHGGEVSPRAEALLFAADKAQHVDHLIRPALDRGEDVVTDRYTDSSIAYQGAGRDLGPDEIHRLLDWAVAGLFPDLTIVLDVPAEVGRQRRGSVHDRLEREHDAFHDRVRRHFLDLAAAAPERYLVVDGTQPPARLHAEIVTRLHGIPALAGLREATG